MNSWNRTSLTLLAAGALVLALACGGDGREESSTENEPGKDTPSPDPQAVWDQDQWDQQQWS